MLVKVCEVGGGEHSVEVAQATGMAVISAAAAATKNSAEDIRLICRGRRVERSMDALPLAEGETVVLFKRRMQKVEEEEVRRSIKDEIAAALKQYECKDEDSSLLTSEEAMQLRKNIEAQLHALIEALFKFSASAGGSLDLTGVLGRIGEEPDEDEDEDEDADIPEADLPEAELSLPDDEESSMIVDSEDLTLEEESQPFAGQSDAAAAAEDSSAPPDLDLTVDEASLQQLVDMGFSSEAARKALLLNQSNTEQALNWLLEHSADDDINDPLTPQQLEQLAAAQRQFSPNAHAQQQLLDMGFPQEDVVQALRACDNNYEAACAWLLGDRVEVPRTRNAGPGSILEMFSALTQGSLLKAIQHNPEMEGSMRSPKTLKTLKYLTAHPRKVQHFVNDPLVGCIISEIFRIIRMAFASR